MPARALMFAAVLGAIALPGAAQTVSAADPDSLVRALRDQGYRAILETDDTGNPKISSAMEGVNYAIFFYGCENNTLCKDIQFSAGFDLEKGTTEFRMNDWNRDWVIVKAVINSENDPFIQMFVPGIQDMSRASFGRVLFRWGQGLVDFKAHIDW